ncbi:MAG: response regulator transcription factor [Rhodanobacter sp.]|jgi:DNA-binding NarL/FixJ family response regulator|nr:response regulator transcription factor [Rhodanobacter sp.]
MKILVVDDHPIVRRGLVALLSHTGSTADVIEAANAEEAYRLVAAHGDLDIVLLDLMMPGCSGLAALTKFRQTWPQLPVIVLSSSECPDDARAALAQGALGYVPKSASHSALLSAVQLVMQGEVYVPPLLLAARPELRRNAPEAGGRSGPLPLTERQIEVLKRLSLGQPNKIIADDMGLSEKTVKAHISAIFKALAVVNRTQAANAGRTLGLI